MLAGRCSACGFDPDHWTDAEAIADLAAVPGRWACVLEGVGDADLCRRPVVGTWSIAEYVDHVRETMFAMRFLVDVAVDTPGTDLGVVTDARFDADPRSLDPSVAQRAFADEVRQLCARLAAVPATAWSSAVVLASTSVDVHWIVRNSLHETSHHLGDIVRLRTVASHPWGDDARR